MSTLYYLEGDRGDSVIGKREVQVFENIDFINLMFFCPECGKVWARAVYGPSPGISRLRWSAVNKLCPDHGDGTLLQEYSLDSCEPALIEREFTLLLKKHALSNL